MSDVSEAHFSRRIKFGNANIWHQWLGQLQALVVWLLGYKNLIDVTGFFNSKHLCDSSQLGKLNRFSFSLSKHSNTTIFEKKFTVVYEVELLFFLLESFISMCV